MSIIKIVGIDPAMSNFGLALAAYNTETGAWAVARVKLIHTESDKANAKVVRKSSDDLRRARELQHGMLAFIREHGCTLAIAEVPTGAQSSRASFSNGMCVGILAGLAIPLIEVTPTEVKVEAVGKKTASKDDMIEWASKRWPGAGWLTKTQKGVTSLVAANEHLADACGAVNAGVLTAQFAQAVALMRAAMPLAA